MALRLLNRSLVAIRKGVTSVLVLILFASLGSAWVLATAHREAAPPGDFTPRIPEDWPLSGDAAPRLRKEALRQAQVRLSTPLPPRLDRAIVEPPLTCRFLTEAPSGTSPKFACVLPGGEVVKVKYGRNPEIPAEVAGTRLLGALGFPADRMSIVSKIRCYGCPREPFVAMHLIHLTRTSAWFARRNDDGYSEFEWVAVERKFPAHPIELLDRKGWGWWELKAIDPSRGAGRADVDALRLLAVFLTHWDNKDENQRLVCLDAPREPNQPCQRPLAMIQDLGATFGPSKVHLEKWRTLPIWADPQTCTVSMRHLPYNGATFVDARISEAARAVLARQLSSFTDEEIEHLFAAARFAEDSWGMDDSADAATWREAFKERVRQITAAGPCPQ